jgi:hypothetical protein
MVKVIIKKNVKPKKIKQKQKQKQTQKTNINIKIGDTITKKKRGRPAKRSTIEKKPVQQIAPVIQSYNQPVFNKPAPQSTFASILASQEKPNIIAKELKDQSTITQALVEQNTQTEEPKVNDLERVRKERVKKLDKVDVELKPLEEAYKNKSYESSQGINKALISQLFDEKGDDTEEINQLISESNTSGLFRPAINIPNPLSGVKIPTISNPLSGVKIPTISNPLSGVKIPTITNSIENFLHATYGGNGEESIPPQEIIDEDPYAGGVEETKEEETQSILNSSVNIPSNISSLSSSGISTPTPLSQPVNPQTLYDKLEDIAPEPEQVIIPHYKNYDFIDSKTDYNQSELETKRDELINEELQINQLLKDQLSNIGLTLPQNGVDYKFLQKYKDELSDDLIDLITYVDDLNSEEKRIDKKIIKLEQEKPILKPVETPPTILQPVEKPPVITQSLQAEEEEPLIKKKKIKKAIKAEEPSPVEEPTPPIEIKSPEAEEPLLEKPNKIKKTKKDIKVNLTNADIIFKWKQLESQGLITENYTRTPDFENPSKTKKNKYELLDDIREVDPEWEKQFLK